MLLSRHRIAPFPLGNCAILLNFRRKPFPLDAPPSVKVQAKANELSVYREASVSTPFSLQGKTAPHNSSIPQQQLICPNLIEMDENNTPGAARC